MLPSTGSILLPVQKKFCSDVDIESKYNNNPIGKPYLRKN